MINKKAQTSSKGWIIGLILMAVLLVVIFSFIRGGVIGGGEGLMGMVKGIFTKSPSGTPSILDPCQCGWPTSDKYEQVEHEGALYCVHSKIKCKDTLDSKLYKSIDYKVIQGADAVPLCVYSQSDCMAYGQK